MSVSVGQRGKSIHQQSHPVPPPLSSCSLSLISCHPTENFSTGKPIVTSSCGSNTISVCQRASSYHLICHSIDCTHRYQTHLQRRADSWRREDMRGEQAAEELLCRQATFDPALFKYWHRKHRTQWRIPWRKLWKCLNRCGPWRDLAQNG